MGTTIPHDAGISRRAILQAASGALALPVFLAQAQPTYPVKPIKIVSPYSAGGLGDTLPRALGVVLGAKLGQQIVVENRPGASQAMGAQYVAKTAESDGYTLFWASTTNMAINPISQPKLPYDPVKDFAPIGVCFTSPLYLLVNPALPVKSVKGLIAYGKSHPGKLTYASGGAGSTNHLAGAMFSQLAGIDMLHVPYKGAGPAIVDLMSGQVNLMFESAGIEYARRGQLRALAVGTRQRTHSAPDLPTVIEAGLPGFDVSVWFGLAAPAGTPAAVMSKLTQALHDSLADPALARTIGDAEITPTTPQGMSELVHNDTEKWRNVITQGSITFD